jgi:radical SAM protein with 4Fe4S-binding SPASM domain
MRLRHGVIAREEDDGWLLYNGENGALVRVAHDTYQRFFVEGKQEGDAYEDLSAWLLRHGFLGTCASSPPPILATAAERAAVLDGFFSLRSERSPLNVLWAVTANCNLRCVYCFPDARAHAARFSAPPFDALLGVADQLVEAKVLKVLLSGGECLLLPRVWEIAERLQRAGISVTLLSNGATIGDRVAERARGLGVTFGVSLDGPDEEANALTRGPGAYHRTVRGLRKLIERDVPVAVMITVTRHNFGCIERLVAQLEGLGVDSVTLQDLQAFGTRETYDRTRLTVGQEQQLEALFQRLRTAHPTMHFQTTELFYCSENKRSDRIMQCPAGEHFAYVDFHGNVYPCTALPTFRLGNLLRGDSLVDVWRHSEQIQSLRRLKQLPLTALPGCAACADEPRCDGGCRGDALFYRGDLYSRPSRCPKELGLW